MDTAADNFCMALKDSWLGSVSSQQLPMLVSSSYGVLMTFRTAIWRLISDESVWPSRLRSVGFCKMAPIVRQSLTSIPALCGLVVPPRPVETTATPPPPTCADLLGEQRLTAASPQAPSTGPAASTPAGTPTAPRNPSGFTPARFLTDGTSGYDPTFSPADLRPQGLRRLLHPLLQGPVSAQVCSPVSHL